MPAFSRRNIVKALSIIGLKKTLVALRDGDSYSISQLTTPDGEPRLGKINKIADPKPLVIGRVGMPDPNLSIRWNNSMTFYGSWFDELGASDSDYRIRNSILGLSREKLIDQVRRDDRYGLIGTYYAVFLEILDQRKGVPVVVLDDSLLGFGSFPVVIPHFPDAALEQELSSVLRLMLKKELAAATAEADAGLEVDQVSAEEMGKYFPA
jgi:hypothetical protein